MALSNRERFKAIAMGNRPGDVMIMDRFHRCLVERIHLSVIIPVTAKEELRGK